MRRFVNQTTRVMRILSVIMLAFTLSLSARTVSQTVTFKGKDVPLTRLFEEVKKQTGLYVMYSNEQVANAKPVSVEAKQVPVDEFVSTILKDQPFQFSIEGNTVFIRTKQPTEGVSPRLNLPSLDTPPEPIRGVVKDSTGMPLSGATVMNKRTKKSVQTNAKGEFTLLAEDGDILALSFIGFETQTIRVTGSSMLAVLRVSSSPLDEIQIRAYGTTSKRLNTGNISTVKAEEINKQPVNNPLLALSGRVPGLEITQTSGIPGAPVVVKIRGTNSLSFYPNANAPLFVIDGLPFLNDFGNQLGGAFLGGSSVDFLMNSALSLINPTDIESIDILKDADATSIYGSRGANGVILITTKKGKAGKTRFNVTVQSGIGEVARKARLLNVDQYKQMRLETLRNSSVFFNNPYYALDTTAIPSSYPDLFLWKGKHDWQDEMIGGRANYNDANASVSGGTSMVQYMIGGTYHKETTVFPGNSADHKANLHFNITGISANQRFRTSLTGGYMSNWKNFPVNDLTRYITLAPTTPDLLREDGSLNWAPYLNYYGFTYYLLEQNPFSILFKPFTANTNNLISSGEISYKIVSALQAKITLGYNQIQSSSYSADPSVSRVPGSLLSRASQFRTNNVRSVITEPQLLYRTVLGLNKIDVLFGGSFQSNESKMQFISASGFASDEVMENQSAAAQFINENTSSQFKYAAVFARLNYNFSDKYIVNLNARRDGSSRFGPGKQFGNFGSIGTAWVFSEENAVKRFLRFLSFGKLRVSYGTAGNDGISDYAYLERYFYTSFSYFDTKGLVTTGVFNNDYHWESIKKGELGLELGFFNDRITAQTSYYRNRSSNQLQRMTLPNMVGPGDVVYNSPATVQNSGVEFVLNTQNIKSAKFNWITSINFSRQRNKLVAYPDIENSAEAKLLDYKVGQPIGIPAVYKLIGVDPSSGLYQFADINGNPIGGGADASFFQRVAVNTNPEYYAGVSNTISYKNISLFFLFQFVKQLGNNYLYSFPQLPGSFSRGTILSNQPVEILEAKRWQKPGDMAVIGKFYRDNLPGYTEAMHSDRAYSDASFARLKNISLSFELPSRVKERLKVDIFRIFIEGQNVLTITNFKGLDPENQSVSSLPPLRVITARIQVGF